MPSRLIIPLPLPPSRPRRWGADERLLRYRSRAPPTEDPGVVRGHLPTFCVAPPSAPESSPGAPAFPPNVAQLVANPLETLAGLPEHTHRLILAQSMLSRQRIINARVAERQRWERARWEAWRAHAVQQLRARERRDERDDAVGAETDPATTTASNANANSKSSAWKTASRRALTLARVRDGISASVGSSTDAKTSPPVPVPVPVPVPAAARTEDGLVDLTPAPPLPPIPPLLSLIDRAPGRPVAGPGPLAKAKPGETAAEAIREAALSAAATAGTEAFGRGWRGIVTRDAAADESEARRRGDSTRTAYQAARDEDRRSRATEANERRLAVDAADATRAGKFVRAEVILRQLLASVAGRRAARGRGDGRGDENATRALGTVSVSSGVDPPEAAPVLYRLSQAVGRQRGRRREEESLLLRALDALDAAAEADQDRDRTDDAQIRYRLFCALHACRAAPSDDAREDPRERRGRDEDAERFATAALDVAERAFGPWHPHVADALYRWATCLCRRGAYADAEAALERARRVSEKARGERHPETGRILCALAQTHKRAGNFQRAARFDREWRRCPAMGRARGRGSGWRRGRSGDGDGDGDGDEFEGGVGAGEREKKAAGIEPARAASRADAASSRGILAVPPLNLSRLPEPRFDEEPNGRGAETYPDEPTES